MKKTMKYMMLAAVAMVMAAGCGKKGSEPDLPEGTGPVAGQWHLIEWSSLSDDRADIYISFGEDGTFDLYQRLYTPYYEHYDGNYIQDGATVSGTYSDGTAWGSSYTAVFTEDRSRMTLTPDGNGTAAVYEASDIPEEILSGSLSGTKSGIDGPDGYRFL